VKKYVFLTSMLALAACGGGGHGGGVAPTAARSVVSDDVVASNGKITSMASEVLVASDGTIITPSLNRSATANYNGKIYDSYRLDDVNFKLSGEDSYVTFEVDDKGQIIALTKYDRNDDFTGTPTYAVSEEGRFVRSSATGNEFKKSLYEYAVDLPESGSFIANNHFRDIDFKCDTGDLSVDEIKAKFKAKIDREMDKLIASQPDDLSEQDRNNLVAARQFYKNKIDEMNSFEQPHEGRATLAIEGIDKGLRFADLGFAELIVKDNTDVIQGHTFTPYVGGYDVLKIDTSKLSGTTKYTGTAIAGIDHKRYGYEGDEDIDDGMLVQQDNARLTVNTDGSSSLVMDNLVAVDEGHAGKHWYNVTVNTAATTGLPTFEISGTTNATGFELPSMSGETLTKSFTSENFVAHEQQYVQSSDTGGSGERFSGIATTTVYGRTPDDTEATSSFGFANEVHSNNNREHEEVAIYGAFGGKHD